MSLLIRALILLDQGSTLMTSFNLNYFLKGPISNSVTLGVRASIYEFGGGGHNSVCKTYFHHLASPPPSLLVPTFWPMNMGREEI